MLCVSEAGTRLLRAPAWDGGFRRRRTSGLLVGLVWEISFRRSGQSSVLGQLNSASSRFFKSQNLHVECRTSLRKHFGSVSLGVELGRKKGEPSRTASKFWEQRWATPWTVGKITIVSFQDSYFRNWLIKRIIYIYSFTSWFENVSS